MSAIFPVVSADKASTAVKQFRGVVFPEEEINDALYVKKAKDMMKKLFNVNVSVKPVPTHEEENYRHVQQYDRKRR